MSEDSDCAWQIGEEVTRTAISPGRFAKMQEGNDCAWWSQEGSIFAWPSREEDKRAAFMPDRSWKIGEGNDGAWPIREDNVLAWQSQREASLPKIVCRGVYFSRIENLEKIWCKLCDRRGTAEPEISPYMDVRTDAQMNPVVTFPLIQSRIRYGQTSTCQLKWGVELVPQTGRLANPCPGPVIFDRPSWQVLAPTWK